MKLVKHHTDRHHRAIWLDFCRGGLVENVSAPIADPVPDHILHYLLDGTDTDITRVGTDDYVTGPETDDATGTGFDGSTQYFTVGATDRATFASIGTGALSFAFWFKAPNSNSGDFFSNGAGL